jgi:hypothetical protein
MEGRAYSGQPQVGLQAQQKKQVPSHKKKQKKSITRPMPQSTGVRAMKIGEKRI